MKTITGQFSGAANGTVRLELSKYALIGGSTENAPRFYQIFLDSNGSIPANYQVWANDELMPEGTSYKRTVFDSSGNIILGPDQILICGTAPINLTGVTPGPPQITVSISPASATLHPGQTQLFMATVTNVADQTVTWIASLGTIDAGGLYTAPPVSVTTAVTITAVSRAAPSSSAAVSISVQPGPGTVTSVSISPGSASLAPGATQQFTATVAPATTSQVVTWTATNGTITSGGLFTAANVTTATIGTVTATSIIDTTKLATVSVSIQPVAVISVTVTPQTVTLAPGGTQQFNAVVNNSVNQTVNWSTTVGTITSAGLYTAPSNVSVTTAASVVAVAAVNLGVNGAATVIIAVSGAVTISPLSLALNSGQQQQFTAVVTPTSVDQTVTWSVSAAGGVPAGMITSTGLYTAPTTTNGAVVTVTAVSVAVPSESASVVFTVSPTGVGVSITIAPQNAVMTAGGQLTFSAVVNNSTDQEVIWTNTAGGFFQYTDGFGPNIFYADSVTVQTIVTITVNWTQATTPPVSATTTLTINPVTVGQIDVLTWASLNSRATQHMAGDPHAPYSVQVMHGDALYPAGYPANTYFQIKNKLGNPWDIRKYDNNYIYHWITENGDSVDTPTCESLNGSTCWLYARAYKRFVNPLRGWPRYLTPGTPVTIPSLGPNTTLRTVNCEQSLTGTITLGDVKTITSGPTKYTWGGNIDKGAGTTTSGPRLDSVNGVDTIKNEYYYSGTIAADDFKDREEYYFVQGFGEIAWYYYHRTSATAPWVWQNQTVNSTFASGGAPAPNFPCGAGKSWWV